MNSGSGLADLWSNLTNHGPEFMTANSQYRDPWVRTFFNKETGIFTFYHLDFYIDVGPPVSLLRYEKGDRRLMDYAPV